MVYVGQMSEINNFSKSGNKIPEYARDYKKEYLFIRGINRTTGRILTKIENIIDYEKVFSSPGTKTLVRDFRKVLSLQRMGKLQNISELKFKLSDVEKIIHLRNYIYINMGFRFPSVFNLDEDFQYLFENLIMFTNICKIKNEDDFEDDIYGYLVYDESESESDIYGYLVYDDSESESENNDNESESENNDNESESENNDNESESDESD